MLRYLLGAAASQAFDYYVDSAGGDDSNAGTSEAAAFATLAPLTAMGSALANKRIGIKRGSVLASVLTSSANGVSVDAYGSGDRPLIDCADYFAANTGWAKTAGRTNVYERTITLPNDVKAKGNVWSGDNFLVQVASLATCDSTPGSAFVTDWAAASATLYIHAIGSTDPTSNGIVYSYSRRLWGINLSGSGCAVRNIRSRRNAHQDGSIIVGPNGVGFRLRIEDGCRHSALFNPGASLTECYFFRGRNDLEGSANSLVVNAANVIGLSYSTTDCTFDAGDTPAFTGPQNHGANANDLYASITHTRPVFIGMLQCLDSAAQNVQVVNPTFANCVTGVQSGRVNAVCTVSGGTGTLDQLCSIGAAGTVNSLNNTLTVPAVRSGFYASTPTSGVTLSIDGDVLTIADANSRTVNNNDLIRIVGGTLSVQNLTIRPVLANPSTVYMRAGFSGGTVTVTANNNSVPLGASWIINGTTYSTLAAWQATGQDAASSYGAIPAPSFTDNFDRADENLEASANWTRIGGAAAQAAVRSNELAMIGGTTTLYAAPALANATHYVRGTIRGAIPASPASFPLALRGLDQGNFVGVRWGTSALQVFRAIGGTFNQAVSHSVTPAAGDDIVLAVRGDFLWLYRNNAGLQLQVPLSASALVNNTLAGTVPRGVQNPAVDNFACGVC